MIAFNENGWMSEELAHEYLQKVWGVFAFQKRMLVWDSLRAHLTNSIREKLHSMNTVLSVIPAGCTPLLQPADLSWNAPFKAHFRELYNKWLSSGAAERTAAGNFRAVSRVLLVDFVKESWKSLSPDIIKRSFQATGIVT